MLYHHPSHDFPFFCVVSSSAVASPLLDDIEVQDEFVELFRASALDPRILRYFYYELVLLQPRGMSENQERWI